MAPIEPSDGLRDENTDWRERLLCSRGSGQQVDMVVTGPRGPPMLETIEMGLPKAQSGEQIAARAGEPS